MRLKTPISDPLSYARATELLQRAYRQAKTAERLMNDAHNRESAKWEELKRCREELAQAKSVITDREFDIASLKREMEAKPTGDGRHSELVMQLVEKVIGRGDCDFESNSNGPDYNVCPHCYARARVTYRQGYADGESIEHEKDCAYGLAEIIRDSQPD